MSKPNDNASEIKVTDIASLIEALQTLDRLRPSNSILYPLAADGSAITAVRYRTQHLSDGSLATDVVLVGLDEEVTR